MGGDRSLTCQFTCMLKGLQYFKESKEKKTKSEKRRIRWKRRRGKYRRVAVKFGFLKQDKKCKNTHGY